MPSNEESEEKISAERRAILEQFVRDVTHVYDAASRNGPWLPLTPCMKHGHAVLDIATRLDGLPCPWCWAGTTSGTFKIVMRKLQTPLYVAEVVHDPDQEPVEFHVELVAGELGEGTAFEDLAWFRN